MIAYSLRRAVIAMAAATACMTPVVASLRGDSTQEKGVTGEDGQVLQISEQLFDFLGDYQGKANQTFVSYLVKNQPEVVAEWATNVDRSAEVGLLKFMESNFPVVMEDQEDMKDVGSVAVGLAIEHPEYLNTWEIKQVPDKNRLETFVTRNYGELYKGWTSSKIVPSEKMCLLEYAEMVNPELVPEVTNYMMQRYGKIIKCWWLTYPPSPTPPPPTPPPSPDCRCTYLVTFSNNQFITNSGSDTSGDVRHNWWSEVWKAAHYGELYAYIWKEPMTTFEFAGINNVDEARVRYMLDCTNSDGQRCGKCIAKLDQYVHYGSEIQVHNDGKAGLFRPLRVKAAAGDSAKMTTTLANGEVVGFEKGGAMTISSKDTYDGTKVINIIKNVITIAAAFATGGTSAGITSVTKLGADTVKNFFGIIKYEGTKGTKSAELKVTYDSISDATDPTHLIESNIQYTTKVKSAGSVSAEMKGKWAKTNNSFYGSGFAIAIGVHSFFCDADVQQPSPMGAWSYANTYRSPYPNTNGLAYDAASFIQQATGSLPNTSFDQGYEEF